MIFFLLTAHPESRPGVFDGSWEATEMLREGRGVLPRAYCLLRHMDSSSPEIVELKARLSDLTTLTDAHVHGIDEFRKITEEADLATFVRFSIKSHTARIKELAESVIKGDDTIATELSTA